MNSDYNTGPDLFPEKEQDGFTVVNARIGLRGPDQRWSIEFWGQNIFNTDYTQVAFSTPLQSSSPGTSTTGQFGTGAPMANQLIRSEEHTSELQSLMRISYAVFCLTKKRDETRRTEEQKQNHKTGMSNTY